MPIDPEYDEIVDAAAIVRTPVVSVIMVTYNHAAYLAQAIEGVMAQRCSFEYELVIGEDLSTDATRAIAMEYQQRHPDRIRVVCSRRNVGAGANHYRAYMLSRGEFVAHCEGDDYWCDPDRLEEQVRLLRERPDCAMVHTDWVRARPQNYGWRVEWDRPVHRRVCGRYLQGDLFQVFYYAKLFRNCTVMQRRSALDAFHFSGLARGSYRFGDTVVAAFLTSRWQVAYWPRVGAVYRESPGSALRSGRLSFVQFLRSALQFDSDARAFFAGRRDYPTAYRWECAVGLLLNTLRLCDMTGAREAFADLRRHYGPLGFLRAFAAALRLRLPCGRIFARRTP